MPRPLTASVWLVFSLTLLFTVGLNVACTSERSSPSSAPVITGFSPASGLVGTPVTLEGIHFQNATSVRFQGANAPFQVVSDGRITATLPAGAGSGPISVETHEGIATSSNSFTVEAPVLHPVIDPNWRTRVSYLGRFDQSDELGPRFSWSGSGLRAAFRGTNISLVLAQVEAWSSDYLQVRLDGGEASRVKVDHDGTYLLASDLEAGPHTIEVIRRDEGAYSELRYLGFALDQGELLDPPGAAVRRLEVIGDSITCGYGNEAIGAGVGFSTDTENACLAYESVAARLLDADLSIVAWSGKGISRNFDGSTTELLGELYPRTLARCESPVWDFTSNVPQVVVINLGTNDFAQGVPDRAVFVSAYLALVSTIRSHYPDAHVCCVVGPMLEGDALVHAIEFIQVGVVESLTHAGDAKLHFIQFPAQDGSDGYGADWHPSVARHQKMGEQLAAELRVIMAW